jgi:hypothetical protein
LGSESKEKKTGKRVRKRREGKEERNMAHYTVIARSKYMKEWKGCSEGLGKGKDLMGQDGIKEGRKQEEFIRKRKSHEKIILKGS